MGVITFVTKLKVSISLKFMIPEMLEKFMWKKLDLPEEFQQKMKSFLQEEVCFSN